MKPSIKILAKNQLVMCLEDRYIFQSYNTLICEVTNFENGNKPVFKVTEGQPQSKTTAKYFNMFLNQFFGITNYKNL